MFSTKANQSQTVTHASMLSEMIVKRDQTRLVETLMSSSVYALKTKSATQTETVTQSAVSADQSERRSRLLATILISHMRSFCRFLVKSATRRSRRVVVISKMLRGVN